MNRERRAKEIALDIYRRLNNKNPYETVYPRDPLEPIEDGLLKFAREVQKEFEERMKE